MPPCHGTTLDIEVPWQRNRERKFTHPPSLSPSPSPSPKKDLSRKSGTFSYLVTIFFPSSSVRRYDVVWLHDEKEIKPSKDFEYRKVGDNTHVLEIHEIFPEDAGTYTCEAFNDVGECFSSCTLVVDEGEGQPEEERNRPQFRSFPR